MQILLTDATVQVLLQQLQKPITNLIGHCCASPCTAALCAGITQYELHIVLINALPSPSARSLRRFDTLHRALNL